MASAYTSVNPAAVVDVPSDGIAAWGRCRLLRIEKVPQGPAMVAPVRTLRKSVP
jgi:hypothetical protein